MVVVVVAVVMMMMMIIMVMMIIYDKCSTTQIYLLGLSWYVQSERRFQNI